MNFKDIKINTVDNYNTFIFNKQEIKVLKYLPIEEKFDLIMTAIQKSNVNGVYNDIKLEVFFDLNIVYLYTDINFDIEDRVNESALYDNLFVTGLLTQIKENMEAEELANLTKLFQKCLEAERAYKLTAAAIISKLVDDLPKNAEAAKNIVDEFDPNKFSQVIKMAQDLNNGKLS